MCLSRYFCEKFGRLLVICGTDILSNFKEYLFAWLAVIRNHVNFHTIQFDHGFIAFHKCKFYS